ncbi:glycosyltransferase family 22 protein [Sodiomyces alcalophilus JCM 7366]|uniref:glycosyltransferase family 22 protein n=1 Tax=Sodiomyces alcalophilus JCM 7366 TaxID=591952 RepID=UPI0039B402FA
MKSLDTLLALLLPSLILLHLFIAPHTKVEESFTIQSVHDILVYGTPTHDINARFKATYDHFTFPGAVPRSFVGPVLLAGVSQPLVHLAGFSHAQLVVRAVLGLFNAACLLFFARSLARGLGVAVSRWWLLLMASQFHVMFYASRTLPNMFAFGLTTLSSALLLPHPDTRTAAARQRVAISMLVFSTVVFRSEVALLLATTGLHLLLTGRATITQLVVPFAISFVAALAISVPIDSYFWQKPIWPELWAFAFNVLRGGASDWGTSPWHYYFSSALPRLLLNPLALTLLIPFAATHPATAPTARALLLPGLLFVSIYSFQPHKEARFIFYVVPSFTAAAAQGANLIFARRTKSLFPHGLLAAVVALSVLASFVAASAILLISALNYPGGEALAHLHAIVESLNPPATTAAASSVTGPAVHADVLACMTGVTLFAQNRAGLPLLGEGFHSTIRTVDDEGHHHHHHHHAAPLSLDLDKTEDPTVLRDLAFWSRFDYLLMEDPSQVAGGAWDTIAVVEGYAGIEILRPGRDDASPPDLEAQGQGKKDDEKSQVVGKGRMVEEIKKRIRALTGGWWVGPRMEPRIRIMERIRDLGNGPAAVASE